MHELVMAKWCCEIADFCKYKRETVAIAMNCLDRFMSTPVGHQILLDRNAYQLASMTALYSAVKIHEQEAMDPNLVSSRLRRGVLFLMFASGMTTSTEDERRF